MPRLGSSSLTAEAKAALTEVDKAARSASSTSGGRKELDALFSQYALRLERRGRTEQTIRSYRWVAGLYSSWLASKGLLAENATPEHLEEFFYGLDLAPSTKRLVLTHIRATYRYAHLRGLCPMDPTYDLEVPVHLGQQRPRVLSIEKLRELRDACYNDRQWLLFHLFAYTGMRRNEARPMRWEQVDLKNNTLLVHGKGHKDRLVPIYPVLGEVLSGQRRADHLALFPNPRGNPICERQFVEYLKTLDTTRGVTFHDFRRTVATSLDANGVDEAVIMRIMGWAPKTVFDRHYRNVADDRLQKGILQLYRREGGLYQ